MQASYSVAWSRKRTCKDTLPASEVAQKQLVVTGPRNSHINLVSEKSQYLMTALEIDL